MANRKQSMEERGLPRDFPARVRAARAYTGWRLSQEEFARRLGVDKGTLRNWERADARADSSLPLSHSRAGVVAALSRASGLPEWFFTLDRLRLASVGGDGVERVLERIDRLADGQRRISETLIPEMMREIARQLETMLTTLVETGAPGSPAAGEERRGAPAPGTAGRSRQRRGDGPR